MNNLQIELYEAAKGYLSQGFSVIPIGSEKKPLFTWKEFQSRKATLEEAQAWFDTLGDRITGIALVTGAISGVVVVDVEKDGPMDHLPDTVCSESGGGGFHYYYKYDLSHPIQNHTRVRALTDIRGDGGYIILPPSLHASGGRYSWIYDFGSISLADFPYWLIEDALEKSHGDGPVQEGGRNEAAARYAGKLLHDLDPSLWDSQGWQEFVSWNESNCNPPVPQRELKTVWNSIRDRESKKPKEDPKQQKTEVYSKRIKGGVVLETLFNQEEERTCFSLWDGNSASEAPYYFHLGKLYGPPPPTNELVARKNVKLPSEFLAFGSEAELLAEVRAFIHDYVELSDEFEAIASYYVPFTWVYDLFKELPYLRVLGDFGSGKSRFLQVMAVLCYKSITINGASSTSSLFRIIDEVRGTLILDEADYAYSDTTQEIVKILNSGFQEGTPVYRSEGKANNSKSFDPRPFDVFCPKVIATREFFHDEALESRCLTHAMTSLTRENIKENLDDEFHARALKIRNKLLAFRFSKLSQPLTIWMPKLEIEPRLRQIATPVYSLFSDESVKGQILEFLKHKQDVMRDQRFNSFEGELLRSYLELREDAEEPTIGEIADYYNRTFGTPRYQVKAKKVGQVMENIFHLKRKKQAKGYSVVPCEENELRLEKLKAKYGLDEAKVNNVNVVNLPWDAIDNPQQP